MADRYRQLFLTLGDAVFLVDAAGAVVEANTAAAWLLGYPAQELAGRDIRTFLAPESLDNFNAQWQTLKSFERLQFEARCVTASRAVVSVLLDVSVVSSEKGKGEGEDVFLVLARQAAERDELEREARLQRLSAGRGLAVPTATFFVSRSGQVGRYPPPAADEKPQPLDWMGAELTGQRLQALLQRAWAGEEAAAPPAWYGPAAGQTGAALREQRWLRIVCVPLRAQGTDVTHVCVRVLDETDRRLEYEAQRQHDQERHGDLLAEALYHDLNNCLSVILAQASGLKLAAPPGQLPPPGVGAITDAAQQAAGLLRSAAHAHAQPVAGGQRAVDLNGLVLDCATLLAHVGGERVSVEMELGRDLPAVAGDEDLLQAAIVALGRQMQRILPAGSRLVLKTFRVRAGTAGVPASAGLSIGEDASGQGAARPALTDDVNQSAAAALARAVVRAHHGRCESVSSTVQGAFWEVTLPGVAEAPGAPSSPAAAQAEGGAETAEPAARAAPQCRVLLADDEENFRVFMSWALRERGYETVAAKDGQEAFERFQEAPETFGLVILDAYMPRMGGLEAYLRMQVLRPELPVLFASGFVRGPSVDALVEGCPGPASVLLKPFSAEDLVEAVKKAVAPR